MSSDDLVNDAVLVSFFQGCSDQLEQVMDGLAECAGYGRLVDLVRDLQTASGFAHVSDMLVALDDADASLILPSALVSDASWKKLREGFWKMLLDSRHERHDLSEEELWLIFEAINSSRQRFIRHLQWLVSDPECKRLVAARRKQ